MAVQIEDELHESTELVQGSGGIFEVEDNGRVLFSKRELNRFPEDGEVVTIVKAIQQGKTLLEAKELAQASATPAVSFVDWVRYKFKKPDDK